MGRPLTRTSSMVLERRPTATTGDLGFVAVGGAVAVPTGRGVALLPPAVPLPFGVYSAGKETDIAMGVIRLGVCGCGRCGECAEAAKGMLTTGCRNGVVDTLLVQFVLCGVFGCLMLRLGACVG